MAVGNVDGGRIYRREGNGYPTDLKDAEWGGLEPLKKSLP
jgi:hypothetical protein